MSSHNKEFNHIYDIKLYLLVMRRDAENYENTRKHLDVYHMMLATKSLSDWVTERMETKIGLTLALQKCLKKSYIDMAYILETWKSRPMLEHGIRSASHRAIDWLLWRSCLQKLTDKVREITTLKKNDFQIPEEALKSMNATILYFLVFEISPYTYEDIYICLPDFKRPLLHELFTKHYKEIAVSDAFFEIRGKTTELDQNLFYESSSAVFELATLSNKTAAVDLIQS